MAHSLTTAFFVICVFLLPPAIARVSITSSSSLPTKVSRSDSTIRDTKYQRCAVEDWPFCMAACPRDTTIEEALQGEYGAHVGVFVKSPVDREENLTMSGCCTACTDFNSVHFSDIFGYVCDYWSWNKVTGEGAAYRNMTPYPKQFKTYTQARIRVSAL